jgi:hypothetical protein
MDNIFDKKAKGGRSQKIHNTRSRIQSMRGVTTTLLFVIVGCWSWCAEIVHAELPSLATVRVASRHALASRTCLAIGDTVRVVDGPELIRGTRNLGHVVILKQRIRVYEPLSMYSYGERTTGSCAMRQSVRKTAPIASL